MKTQTTKRNMKKFMFVALASLTVMTTACSKNNGGGGAAPPPPPPPAPNCGVQACVGGVGFNGQVLYSGTTTNGFYTQAQFQVVGDASGNGPGVITGTVNINNYVCTLGMPNLDGPFTIQMAQQGSLNADVFSGTVNLAGPQGNISADIEVVPSRTQGAGLITIWLCGSANSMNF